MSRSLKSRLRKLEGSGHDEGRIVTVHGRDKAEHERQIDELHAAGLIDRERDMIVCIMVFGEGSPVPEPTIFGGAVMRDLLQEIGARGRPRPGEFRPASDPSPAYLYSKPR